MATAVVESLPDLIAWQRAPQRSTSTPGSLGVAAGLEVPDVHTKMAMGTLVASTLGALCRGQQPGASAGQLVSQEAAELVLQAIEEGVMLAAFADMKALESAQARLASSGLADSSSMPPGLQDIIGEVRGVAGP